MRQARRNALRIVSVAAAAVLAAPVGASAAPISKVAPYQGEVYWTYVTPSLSGTGTGSATSTPDPVAGTVSVAVSARDDLPAGVIFNGYGAGGSQADATGGVVTEFDGVSVGANKYQVSASVTVPQTGSGAAVATADVRQPVPLVQTPYVVGAQASVTAELYAYVLKCTFSGCYTPSDNAGRDQPTVVGVASRVLRCAPTNITCGNPGTFTLSTLVYVPSLSAGETARILVQAGLRATASVLGDGDAAASGTMTVGSFTLSDPLGSR